MDYEIYSVEIFDHNDGSDFDPTLGNIEVLVIVKVGGKDFGLHYQTSGTSDYGAISSNLSAYQNEAYDDFINIMELDENEADELMNQIKKECDVQKLWNDHVEENYIRNTDYFGGMDGNSEVNETKRKL